MIIIHFFSSDVQGIADIIAVIISIIATVFAVAVSRMLSGGLLGRVWNLLSWAVILFVLYEIALTLESFKLIDFGGIDNILEVLAAVFLVLAFWQAYRMLKAQTDHK
jgi:hypothetical protein